MKIFVTNLKIWLFNIRNNEVLKVQYTLLHFRSSVFPGATCRLKWESHLILVIYFIYFIYLFNFFNNVLRTNVLVLVMETLGNYIHYDFECY